MFVAGVMLFTIASLAGGFATSQAQLVAARVAQGVGGAIASPTALSLITSTFPEGLRRNKAMGVYAAMSGGGALGLLLGGILTDLASWRWVLFVNIPIGLLVALVAPHVLRESETRAGRLDLPGAFSVTGGMTLLVYGLTHPATKGWTDQVTLTALGVAVVLLVAFVHRTAKPACAHAVAHLCQPQPLRHLHDDAHHRRGDLRDVLLPHPVHPEHPGLQSAQGRGRVSAGHRHHRRAGGHQRPTRRPGRSEAAHDGGSVARGRRPVLAVVHTGGHRLLEGPAAYAVHRHGQGHVLRAADVDRRLRRTPGRGRTDLRTAQHRPADRRLARTGHPGDRLHERNQHQAGASARLRQRDRRERYSGGSGWRPPRRAQPGGDRRLRRCLPGGCRDRAARGDHFSGGDPGAPPGPARRGRAGPGLRRAPMRLW